MKDFEDALQAAAALSFGAAYVVTRNMAPYRKSPVPGISKTEKTSTIFPPPTGSNRKEKNKRKGHGRNGAGAYTGARQVFVPHPALKAGQECEKCHQGKVCDRKRCAREVRVQGAAPVTATRYHLQTLRCDTCGEVFTAPLPPEAGTQSGSLRFFIG